MSLANRFRSGRVPHQHIGISSFTEDKLVLDAIGHARISGTLTVGVGTNNSGSGNISIGGTTGDVGQYLRSTGVGIEWADFADVRDSQLLQLQVKHYFLLLQMHLINITQVLLMYMLMVLG